MSVTCPTCGAADTTDSGVCSGCGTDLRPVADATSAWGGGDSGGDAPSPDREFGRFVLLAELGSGAFGKVYKATDPHLGRAVALKIPNAARFDGPGARERFVREARSAAALSHPNVVPVYEVGEHEGLPFIVSEFVDGPSLAEYLKARRPTFAESALLVAALADALHYAHELGVVHRDLKPANILLGKAEGGRRKGEDERPGPVSALQPKVTDFGLAKRDGGDAELTSEGQVLGTPAYMSPEQARGEARHADRRTDVYSLGTVLYQLLTGEVPFRGNARMTLLQVLHDDPRPPRGLNDRVPRDLETVCLKCLEKSPDRRYATAKDLADDLRRFLNSEPVAARPPSAWDRARKFARRNRALVVGTAATVFALLLGVAGTTYGMVQARTEAENAKEAQGRAETAERERRAELANTRAAAARLAAQRGRWGDSLAYYREAINLGAGNEVELRLGVLECHANLFEFDAYRAELAELAARPDLGPHRGMVLVYRGLGEFYGSDPNVDPLATFRDALAAGLPAAEESYVWAVLSPGLGEMVPHLQAAITNDPFHARAHDLLTLSLFLQGRLDEARETLIRFEQLAPNALTVVVYRSFERAVSGDLPAALRVCDEARPALGDDAHALFRGVASLLHDMTRESAFWEANSPLQVRLLQEFAALGPRMAGVLKQERRAANLGAFNMVHLGLFRRLAKLPLFGNPAAVFAVLTNPQAMKELIAELKRVVPMGILDFVEGQILQGEGTYAEAEAAYRRALVTPSLIPAVRRTKLVLLGILEARAWQVPSAEERRAKLAELRSTLWDVFRAGPYPVIYSPTLIHFALDRDEPGMALALAEDWVRRAPDDPKALAALADVQMRLGMWNGRDRTLGRMLGKTQDDAGVLHALMANHIAQRQYFAAAQSALETLRRHPTDPTAPARLDYLADHLAKSTAADEHLRDKLRVWRLLLLARLGEHRCAAVGVADLPANAAPGELVAAAAVLSACSTAVKADASLDLLDRAALAADYSARAAALLGRAEATGHFADPHRVAALRADPDLRPALAHPDCPEAFDPGRRNRS